MLFKPVLILLGSVLSALPGSQAMPAGYGSHRHGGNRPSSVEAGAVPTATEDPSPTYIPPTPPSDDLPAPTLTDNTPPPSGGKPVFAHYMLLTRPPNGDYTNDIKMAKDTGFDAFAVNYGGWGVDSATQQQYLKEMYDACASQGFKAFISVDCTSTDKSGRKISAQDAVELYNKFSSHPAQFTIDGKPLLSTFQVDNPPWNWKTDVLSKLNKAPYFIPSTLSDHADQVFGQDIGADGYFPWIHPYLTPDQEAEADKNFAAQRDKTKKTWMAAVAPWFFKRFDNNNNWAHAQDEKLFIPRLKNLLKLKPDMLEIITWNDWGESSYIGPADNTNECPDCYWGKMDHTPFLEMLKPILAAYKAGQTEVAASKDEGRVWMYYRPQPNNKLGYDDKGLPLPSDAEKLSNNLFVVSLMKEETTAKLSFGYSSKDVTLPVGLTVTPVPFSAGKPRIEWNGKKKDGKEDITTAPDKYNGNVAVV